MQASPFPNDPPPGWYVLCRARDVARRPLAVQVSSRKFVVFRTASDRLAVLPDRCAHRAVPLSAGTVQGETIRCAYHGWEYGADGSLQALPALQTRPDQWPACGLLPVPAREQDGMLWAWVDTRQDRAVQARGTPPAMAHWKQPGWTGFRLTTRFQASVAACLENFLDVPHATFVHRHWFRAPTGRPVKCIVRTRFDGAEVEFFDEPREKSAVWWLLAPRSGPMRHVDRFIAPNTSEVEYEFPGGLHYFITSTCTPQTDGSTEVYTSISFRVPRLGPVAPLVRLVFEPLSRLIIRQDVRMLALQPKSETRFTSSAADLLGPLIHAWRHAIATDTEPPAEGQKTHVEISI